MKELSHKNSFVLTGKLAQKEEEWNSLQRAENFKHLEISSLFAFQSNLEFLLLALQPEHKGHLVDHDQGVVNLLL